ncbi:MAG: peptide-methionine (S)-S-oxide reductase, partial [Gammaproteobacteria bacterium]|nr:peptide-methionine (S)-S-oxide reductase [Gammaproteobacteria bacterium]
MYSIFKSAKMPDPDRALPDRKQSIEVVDRHFVSGNPIKGPFAPHMETAQFGLGCFWGAERKFWTIKGVYT